MTKTVELKDINFPEFKAKLAKKSGKYGYKLTEEKEAIILTWDNNWLGVGFDVEILPINEQSFIYHVNSERVLRLVLVLLIILLIVFYGNLLLFLLSGVGISFLLIGSVRYQSERNTERLINELIVDWEEESDEEEGFGGIDGLRCPACGESLTEYDEYCPSCGLFLGKSWKRQPVSRTGLENIRLEYNFRKKHSEGSQ